MPRIPCIASASCQRYAYGLDTPVQAFSSAGTPPLPKACVVYRGRSALQNPFLG